MRTARFKSLLCVLCVLCGGLVSPAGAAVKRLDFNNRMEGGVGGLVATLSRNLATVDDFANAVAANQVRRGRPIAVADYASWATALSTATVQQFMGAGKSADGLHDLLSYVLVDDHTLNVVKDHNFGALLFQRNLNRADKAVAVDDIFSGTPDQQATRAWVIRTDGGIICSGLWMIRCDVKDWNGVSWDINGMGIVTFGIDSNTGALTLLRRDFIPDPNAGFINRSHGNIIAQTITPDPHYTDPPLVVWFAITDYQTNSGSSSPGGYCVVLRATRASTIDPWVAEPAVMIFSSQFVKLTAQPADGNTLTISIDATNYIFEFDSGGGVGGGNVPVTIGAAATNTLDNLITAINATLPANGMARAVRDTTTQAAANCVNIQGVTAIAKVGANIAFDNPAQHAHTAFVEVKSATAIDVLISYGDGEENQFIVGRCSNKAAYSNRANWTFFDHGHKGVSHQWAGAVLGPDDEHLVTSDGGYEAILAVKTPAIGVDPGVTKASHRYVFGLGTSIENTTVSLWIHTDAAEKRRNYISISAAQNGTQETLVMFSPDGRAWCVVAAMPTGGTFPFISGNRIYCPTLSGNGGMKFIPIPNTRTARPLRLGPGGTQWLLSRGVANWTIDSNAADVTNTFLTQASGKWQDGGVDLPSQPPALGNAIKSVKTLPAAGSQGNNWIAGYDGSGTHPQGIPVPVSDLVARYWVAPMKGHQTLVGFKVDSGVGAGPALSNYFGCQGTFIPHVRTLTAAQSASTPNSRFISETGAMNQNDDFYFAMDLFMTGTNLVPGYPLPEVRNTLEPDEQLTISNLNLGSRWSINVTAAIPWDSWDSVYPLVTEVPLWTAYNGANDHIDVVADIAGSNLLVRVVIAGVTNPITVAAVKYWRCCPLDVCVARTNGGVEVSVRVLGDIKTATGVFTPAVPSEIRFGSPTFARATALDVAEVSVDDAQGLDPTGRAALMNLSATPPAPVGAANRVSVDVGIGN